jgi:hypothetical protein
MLMAISAGHLPDLKMPKNQLLATILQTKPNGASAPESTT